MHKISAIFITMFKEPLLLWLESSLMGKARQKNLIKTEVISILEHMNFDHHAVDDTPYGGGPGELMKISVAHSLINKALDMNKDLAREKKRVIFLDPSGRTFDQDTAKRLAQYDELIFLSGRYEGIDARVHHYVDEAISLGDFVLSSGDMAALTIFDATARMVDGFLGNAQSIDSESHINGRLEASLYTRPKSYDGHDVPLVFQSGNHKEIEKARALESLKKTLKLRPDLAKKYPFSLDEQKLFSKALKNSYPWEKYE